MTSTSTHEEILIFEADDLEDELWQHVIEVLKKNDPSFKGVRYADGNWMNFVFSENLS